MIRRTRPETQRRGAVALEMAICLLFFLMAVFGVFEFGRLMMVRHVMVNAAQVGARAAQVTTYVDTTAQIQAVVQSAMGPVNLKNLNIQVYQTDSSGNNVGAWTSAGFGSGIAVQIDGDYTPMVPTMKILPSTLHLSTRAIMDSEAN
jgi:Flp pilus assembly protein TadG